MAELSVVIPTLNNPAGLRQVLDAFGRQTVPARAFDLNVVVDRADENPDAVDAALRGHELSVRRLSAALAGASANRNAGWRACGSPLVLFTDDDTVPTANLLAEHLAWHRRYPGAEVAVLGHVRWAPELRVTPFMRWLDRGIQFDFSSIKGIDAGWGRFYSANVSLKRDMIERIGGFDEERLPYLYEDLDFGYRGSHLGLHVLYNRRAVVDHLREATLETWRRKMPVLAAAERTFVALHPEVRPYFRDLFTDAAGRPPARGRGVRLVRWLPPRFPILGSRTWTSADLYFRQQLAPHFLAAWESVDPV